MADSLCFRLLFVYNVKIFNTVRPASGCVSLQKQVEAMLKQCSFNTFTPSID